MPSTNTTKNFVIAGGIKGSGPASAGLGSLVAKELLSKGVEVKVIARSGSANSSAAQDLAKLGAEVVEVDYSSSESLLNAVKGADVVLSFLSGDGIGAPQIALAKASKEAGIKLFIPSEYGNNTVGLEPSSPLYSKSSLHQLLKDLDLPFVIIPNGGFAEWISVFFGAKDGKVTITGDGNSPISFTALEDVARFVAHISTTIPLSELSNKVLAIEGSRHTWNEVIALYNKSHSTTLEVTYETEKDALKRWEEAHDFLSWLKAQWAVKNGGLSEPSGAPAGNSLWKEWKPKDVSDFL